MKKLKVNIQPISLNIKGSYNPNVSTMLLIHFNIFKQFETTKNRYQFRY